MMSSETTLITAEPRMTKELRKTAAVRGASNKSMLTLTWMTWCYPPGTPGPISDAAKSSAASSTGEGQGRLDEVEPAVLPRRPTLGLRTDVCARDLAAPSAARPTRRRSPTRRMSATTTSRDRSRRPTSSTTPTMPMRPIRRRSRSMSQPRRHRASPHSTLRNAGSRRRITRTSGPTSTTCRRRTKMRATDATPGGHS